MSNERYKSERKFYAVNLWSNKKMQNFDQRKKRKLLTDNIIKMKAVNKFIKCCIIPRH
jgi:transposase-like protein